MRPAMEDFTELLDLAAGRLGGRVLFANDEFFAEKENLIKSEAAVWLEHEYTERGKWMDGWESRRRREPGYDFALLRLAVPGIIRGVIVDTAFFRGNYPEQCSLEGAWVDGYPNPQTLLEPEVQWETLLEKCDLQGNEKNRFEVRHPGAFNVLRFNIFPDGGVARLRVHGEPVIDFGHLPVGPGLVDLAAALHGGRVVACSDSFFGPKNNLIMPGDARNMGEGWETRRRRGLGHDFVVVRLASQGTIRCVEVDTTHFKGNAPARCLVEGTRAEGEAPGADAQYWPILEATLQPHTRHIFIDEISSDQVASHARLNIYPDGGVARLRLHGEIPEAERARQGLRLLNALPSLRAELDLRACCGSSLWATSMARARPFESVDDLMAQASRIWTQLPPDAHREAFAAHPRIGERPVGSDAHARWSRREQSSARSVSEETRIELARVNKEYDERFGFVFLICATGKTADEMLAAAKERLNNAPDRELAVAAAEQEKITQLRLRRLLTC